MKDGLACLFTWFIVEHLRLYGSLCSFIQNYGKIHQKTAKTLKDWKWKLSSSNEKEKQTNKQQQKQSSVTVLKLDVYIISSVPFMIWFNVNVFQWIQYPYFLMILRPEQFPLNHFSPLSIDLPWGWRVRPQHQWVCDNIQTFKVLISFLCHTLNVEDKKDFRKRSILCQWSIFETNETT